MKKQFVKISVDIIYLSREDVIRTSNLNNQLDDWDTVFSAVKFSAQ